MFFLMFLVMFSQGEAKVNGGQKCENECLDESHQQFKESHENIEQD